MKVQIEIKEEIVSSVILALGMVAKSKTEIDLIEQAVERCKNEVIEIDNFKYDPDNSIQCLMVTSAIAQCIKEIEDKEL